MPTNNPNNERTKHRYFAYRREAKRLSEASIDTVAAALHRFEAYTGYREFKAFHYQQAVAFKRHLADQLSRRSGDRLSKATVYATLAALRNFFFWLAGQPGFRSRLTYSDAEYFNASEKDVRIAKAHRDPRAPTLDQLRHVLFTMPSVNEIERRDRAVVAFIMLSGARDGAVVSLKLKHVDVTECKVVFDAREVNTKFAKSFTTTFFPVGEDLHEVVGEWVEYLLRERLFGPDDPLFPATDVAPNADHKFAPAGLSRRHWSNATPIRAIFRATFSRADFPILILIVSATRSPVWAKSFAALPSSSRRGRKIWATRRCSRHFPHMARSQPRASAKLSASWASERTQTIALKNSLGKS